MSEDTVRVPREPTEEMLEAAWMQEHDPDRRYPYPVGRIAGTASGRYYESIYRAMLAAAEQRAPSSEALAKPQVEAGGWVQVQKDAERYRWLRGHKDFDIAACWVVKDDVTTDGCIDPTKIDAAIDKAMLPPVPDKDAHG